jgi:hypothetical protein
MFEPTLAAERKVSFGRGGLDASKACHISARGDARSRAAGRGSAGPEAGRLAKCYQQVLSIRLCREHDEVSSDYSAVGEPDLDYLGFAAGFWLSIGTANDRPNMSL